jgi:hypothetical protein
MDTTRRSEGASAAAACAPALDEQPSRFGLLGVDELLLLWSAVLDARWNNGVIPRSRAELKSIGDELGDEVLDRVTKGEHRIGTRHAAAGAGGDVTPNPVTPDPVTTKGE